MTVISMQLPTRHFLGSAKGIFINTGGSYRGSTIICLHTSQGVIPRHNVLLLKYHGCSSKYGIAR